MNIFNKKNIGWGTFAVAVFFLIFLYRSYNNEGWFYAFLEREQFIPRQEAFTELYFTDAALLPKAIVKGDKVAFTFTIHNLEGHSMSYPYDVFVVPSATSSSVTLTSGTSTLASGERTNITVQLSFAKSLGRSDVVVRLPESGKEIRFHVNKI